MGRGMCFYRKEPQKQFSATVLWVNKQMKIVGYKNCFCKTNFIIFFFQGQFKFGVFVFTDSEKSALGIDFRQFSVYCISKTQNPSYEHVHPGYTGPDVPTGTNQSRSFTERTQKHVSTWYGFEAMAGTWAENSFHSRTRRSMSSNSRPVLSKVVQSLY